MLKIAYLLLMVTWFALYAQAQERTIHIAGELSRGEKFQKAITPDLNFVLRPDTAAPGAISGWAITVSPQHDHPRECDEFVWVVTPPYRGYNPAHLDTSYGTPAEEAMKFSPRDFNFVLNCSGYKEEEERVDRILWSYNYTEEQVQDAQEKLGSSPQGKGRLWVRDYKISPAPQLAGGKNLGQIDWIRFEVEIQLPKP